MRSPPRLQGLVVRNLGICGEGGPRGPLRTYSGRSSSWRRLLDGPCPVTSRTTPSCPHSARQARNHRDHCPLLSMRTDTCCRGLTCIEVVHRKNTSIVDKCRGQIIVLDLQVLSICVVLHPTLHSTGWQQSDQSTPALSCLSVLNSSPLPIVPRTLPTFPICLTFYLRKSTSNSTSTSTCDLDISSMPCCTPPLSALLG